MGWWFGRKSAPADARPFVPAWLTNESAEEGFARSADGLALNERTSGAAIVYRNGAWEAGIIRAKSVVVNGQQVVGPQAAAVANPSGGSVIDTQARSAIEAVLNALRSHGLIAP